MFLRVRILDAGNEIVDIDDLTGTGLQMAIADCRELLEKLEIKLRDEQ